MAAKKYRGATHLGKLIQDYIELRETNQSEVARAIDRVPHAVSQLVNGHWTRAGVTKPYFGMRGTSKDDTPTLERLRAHLRIPQKEIAAAISRDMDDWFEYRMEQARRTRIEQQKSKKVRSPKQNPWFVNRRDKQGFPSGRVAGEFTIVQTDARAGSGRA